MLWGVDQTTRVPKLNVYSTTSSGSVETHIQEEFDSNLDVYYEILHRNHRPSLVTWGVILQIRQLLPRYFLYIVENDPTIAFDAK
jgi:hypothetical protein